MVMGESTRQGPTVAYSKVLGLVPCVVIGGNDTHHLVKLYGTGKPVSLSRNIVFELADGWGLNEGGELVFQHPQRPDDGGGDGA